MSLSRRLVTLAILLLAAMPWGVRLIGAQEAAQLEITSERYIVVDAATGHVYAQRGANDQVAIASLT